MHKSFTSICCCFFVAASQLCLANNTQDSIPANKFWNSRVVRFSIVPATLFTASAISWGERSEIRKLRNRYIPSFRHHYDDYLQYVPALTVFGLNAAGIKGKHTMRRAFVSYAISAAIMGSIVNTVKYSAKVERPDGSSRNSFPSGHTANSFMNATFVHKEYGQYRHPLYSVAAYTMATATAVGRQLNNRHWISDVLAGAGIGILSTELGYFLADKVFKEDDKHPPLRFNPFPVDRRPSFIEMRMGMGIAISKDLTQKRDDIFAKRGFHLGLEGAWFFNKHVGIGGEFAFTSFPMNSDNLHFDDPDIPTISDGYYTQPMGIRYLSVGPFFSLPLPRNWFITGKLTAGTSVGAQGNVLLELNDEFKDFLNMAELPYLRYKPEKAVCWTAGIGIQKRIGRNTALKLYTSFFDSDHDFDLDILTEVDTQGNFVYQSLGSEKVKFDHITFGLGVTAFIW